MPKIDPITGCTVLTTGEFWQGEAAREGKGRSAGELADEFHEDMEQDRKASEDRYRELPHAFQVLRAAVERMNECVEQPLPLPVEITEIVEVRFSQDFKASSLFLRARARRTHDGYLVEDIIELNEAHFSGSYDEPPDGDENVEWENLDAEGLPVEWKHLYTAVRDFGPKAHPSVPRPAQQGAEATGRRKKVEYLHSVLRAAGLKARIHTEAGTTELQYSEAEQERVYKALGKHLVNLSPYDGLWKGSPK